MANGEYPYTKSTVNSDKLTLEIEAEEFSQTLHHINWDNPDSLFIKFAADLTGPEVTTLGTLVTNHDGNPPTKYKKFCPDCSDYCMICALEEPTVCPICSYTPLHDKITLKVYKQETEPTLGENEITAIWEDTNDSKSYLIYRDSEGNQKVVELD